jgi:hypothetical protein
MRFSAAVSGVLLQLAIRETGSASFRVSPYIAAARPVIREAPSPRTRGVGNLNWWRSHFGVAWGKCRASRRSSAPFDNITQSSPVLDVVPSRNSVLYPREFYSTFQNGLYDSSRSTPYLSSRDPAPSTTIIQDITADESQPRLIPVLRWLLVQIRRSSFGGRLVPQLRRSLCFPSTHSGSPGTPLPSGLCASQGCINK